jgi:hypothetical protein
LRGLILYFGTWYLWDNPANNTWLTLSVKLTLSSLFTEFGFSKISFSKKQLHKLQRTLSSDSLRNRTVWLSVWKMIKKSFNDVAISVVWWQLPLFTMLKDFEQTLQNALVSYFYLIVTSIWTPFQWATSLKIYFYKYGVK